MPLKAVDRHFSGGWSLRHIGYVATLTGSVGPRFLSLGFPRAFLLSGYGADGKVKAETKPQCSFSYNQLQVLGGVMCCNTSQGQGNLGPPF